jgi:hypothetical protein
MKKMSMLILIALITFTVRSQPCLPDGIVFTTQTEIDNFQSNYPNCSEIEGFVTIGEQWFSSDIDNLNGLSVITSVDEYLEIRLNDNLTSLSGLDNITTIGGLFSVVGNNIIEDLSGLSQLSEIGGNFYVGYNEALKSLSGMENLTEIGGMLDIRENDSLVSLTGMENLENIGGGLEIRANRQLSGITELNDLSSIGEHVWINGNDSLASLEGLSGISAVAGYLNVTYNKSLTDLSGIENITTIGGFLEIGHNDMLQNLSGLENLTVVGDYLYIYYNASLTDLSALNGLTDIGAELRISSNSILVSLVGLHNINAASISDLYLHNNSALTTCEIESVCNYLAAPNGAIYITSNAAGCNNQEEVEAACEGASVGENNTISSLTIHPNPFSVSVQIVYELHQPGTVRITFYDLLGTRLDGMEAEQSSGSNTFIWKPAFLPEGIYYFSITTGRQQAGEQVASGKVVKI